MYYAHDRPWDWRWRWYLRMPDDKHIGPFASMTAAFQHRKNYGPVDAGIVSRSDEIRDGLFPPITPEQHRAEQFLNDRYTNVGEGER